MLDNLNLKKTTEGKEMKSRGQIAIAAGVVAVMAAIAVVYFVLQQVEPPLTPESLQGQLPPTTLEEKVAVTKDMADELAGGEVKFPTGSKVSHFSCDPNPAMPGCGAIVDVSSWDEYAQIVRNEIFAMVREKGYDPCKIILAVAIKDTTLYRSYSPAKDPQVVDCK